MIIVSHFVVADMIQLAIFYVLAAAFTSSWQNIGICMSSINWPVSNRCFTC